jgi:spermidine/putrescine-binding protein
MKIKKLLFLAIPAMAISGLTGCGTKYDVKITVYNWADYIYDGTDDDGNIVDKSTVKRFEEYYKEKHNLSLKVEYRTFSTPEEMYSKLKAGSVKADLICPSDYMIQKMANDGLLEPFSYDQKTDKYQESLSNWDQYGSPFIRERFANEKLKDGSSFLTYAVPYLSSGQLNTVFKVLTGQSEFQRM